MVKHLPFQCCICGAVCWDVQASDKPSAWVPHNTTIVASHGICPRCLPRELAKARQASQRETKATLLP